MKVTIEQLKNQDLCFGSKIEDKLYDYQTLEEFYEDHINFFNELTDPQEFINAIETNIEQAKQLDVYFKLPIQIGVNRVKDYIEDWYYDTASTPDMDYEVCFTDKANNLLDKLIKEIHNHNTVYETGKFFGTIDLSKPLKQYIDEEYADELNNNNQIAIDKNYRKDETVDKTDVNKCIDCEYYNDGICNQTTLSAPTSKQVALCKDIDCCFIKDLYKDLQQVKLENEDLKKHNEELTKIKNEFFRQAEISHEAVMNKNNIIEQLEKEIENNRNLTTNKRMEEINKQNKYKKCIDEIKEHIEICNNTMHCKDCKVLEDCHMWNCLGLHGN